MKNIALFGLITFISATSFGYGRDKLIRSYELACEVQSNLDSQTHQISLTKELIEHLSGTAPVNRKTELRFKEVVNTDASLSKTLLDLYNKAQETPSTLAQLTDPALSVFEERSNLPLETEISEFSSETLQFPPGAGVLVSFQEKNGTRNDLIPLQPVIELQQTQPTQYKFSANISYKIFNRQNPAKTFTGLMKLIGSCGAR